jgi:hypothetical protein
MPQVGFRPTIPALERAKTFHASDCAATAIGIVSIDNYILIKVGYIFFKKS